MRTSLQRCKPRAPRAQRQTDDARLSAVSAFASIAIPSAKAFCARNSAMPIRSFGASPRIRSNRKLKKPRPQYTPLPVTRTDYEQIVEWSHHPHTATIHMNARQYQDRAPDAGRRR